MNAEPEILRAALAYAARGWRVLPVEPRGKKPILFDWPNAATTDPAIIREWWNRTPDANVGIATGTASGVEVADEDQAGALARFAVPLTVEARTPKGRHLYFPTNGAPLRNRVRALDGVDVRSDGGFVVAPPSIHATGTRYTWTCAPGTVPLAEMPAALRAALMGTTKPLSAIPKSPASVAPRIADAYGRRALEDEVSRVRAAPVGERNATLNRAAFSLGQLVGGGHLDPGAVEDALTEAGQAAGLDDGEIRATLASGIGDGIAQPRNPEPMPSGVEAARDADTPVTAPAVRVEEHLTDLGNARRFVAMHGNVIRFVPAWKAWLLWDGRCWQRDDLGAVHRLARETVATMYLDAAKEENDDRRRKLAAFAIGSESEKRLRAMVSLAESEDGIAVRENTLDRDPWLLNVANGTLDLRTGELRGPDPADLVTHALDVSYEPDSTCPLWWLFLARVFNADDDLGRFVQRAVGYTLTGSTREQVFLILYGSGANGKSTFLETVRAMLGPLAQSARFDSFLVKRGDAIPNDIARMRGARIVTASESEGGRRLSEATIKDLTGGDSVTARFMKAEFFDFNPTAKIWLSTNHRPEIRGTDWAIWRRVRLVPFGVTIPEAERDVDLKEKLRAELPGILAWAVAGCRDWQAHGLGSAVAVTTSTDAYRREMDLLGDFLDECCVIGRDFRVTSGDLYAKYKTWSENGGINPMAQRTFKLRLEERPEGVRVFRDTGGVRTWQGVALK